MCRMLNWKNIFRWVFHSIHSIAREQFNKFQNNHLASSLWDQGTTILEGIDLRTFQESIVKLKEEKYS